MALIAEPWPEDLCPTSCSFGRTRNDVVQESPRTRKATIVRQGRPLWAARLTWRLPRASDRLLKLRCFLDALEGFAGSVMLWDFGNVRAAVISSATIAESAVFSWTHGGSAYQWENSGSLFSWDGPGNGTVLTRGTSSFTVETGSVSTKIAICGQYVQIGRRLYVVAEDVTTDGSGSARLRLTSGLAANVAAGTAVNFDNPRVEMRLAAQEWAQDETSESGFVTISAPFIETVEDL